MTLAKNEFELLEQLRRGDGKAFRALYDQYSGRVFRFLAQFSKDRDQIKEWCQRTFVKLHENAASFKGSSKFSSWLFQIAINEMRADLRRKKKWETRESGEGDVKASNAFEEDFDWNLTMKAWIQDMKPRWRAVFILYEVEGFSHAEIAELLGVRESTSRSILSLSKLYLRKRYREEEYGQ